GGGPGGGWSRGDPHPAGSCGGDVHGGGGGSPGAPEPAVPPPYGSWTVASSPGRPECGSGVVASSAGAVPSAALQRVQRGNAELVSLPQLGHRMRSPYPVTYQTVTRYSGHLRRFRSVLLSQPGRYRGHRCAASLLEVAHSNR